MWAWDWYVSSKLWALLCESMVMPTEIKRRQKAVLLRFKQCLSWVQLLHAWWIYVYYITGWWFQPLWKIWVRQLGLWHSQYMEKNEQKMFQTTNQIFIICPCVPKTSPKCSVLAPFSDVHRLLEMTPASAAGPEAESPRISLILARNWTWIIASRMITSATGQ